MHTTVPYSKAAFEWQSLLSHRDSGVSSLYLKPLPPLGSHSPNGYLQGIYHLLGKFFFLFLSKCSSKHGPQTSTRFHTAHYWSAVQYAMRSKNTQHSGSDFVSLNMVESSLVSSDCCGRPPEAQLWRCHAQETNTSVPGRLQKLQWCGPSCWGVLLSQGQHSKSPDGEHCKL